MRTEVKKVKNINKKSRIQSTYSVIVEKDEKSGYFAYVPSLPGCVTQGETYEETLLNAKEAIELYLSVIKDTKQKVSKSSFFGFSSISVYA